MYVPIYYFNYRLVDNNIDQIGQAVTVESVVVRNASTIPLIVCRFVRDMNNYTQLPIYSMNGICLCCYSNTILFKQVYPVPTTVPPSGLDTQLILYIVIGVLGGLIVFLFFFFFICCCFMWRWAIV